MIFAKDNVFYYIVVILRVVALLPNSSGKFYNIVLQAIVCALVFKIPVIQIANIVYVLFWDVKYIASDIMETTLVLASCVGFIAPIINTRFDYKSVENLLMVISDFSEFGRPPLMDKHLAIIQFFFKYSATYLGIVSLLFILYGYMTIAECREESEISRVQKICGLPYPILVPLTVINDWLHIYNCITFISINCMTVPCISVFFEFVLYFEILIIKIEDLKENLRALATKKDAELKEHYKYCIRYHIHITDLSMDYNNIYENLLLVYITLGSLLLSLTLYKFLLDKTVKDLMLAFGWSVAIFSLCFIGQRVLNASQSLTDYIYDVEWYTPEHLKMRRDLRFMLMRSQQDIEISVGGVTAMSYMTFKDILSRAYYYLTLIMQTS